jgi:hypothetical protein
VQVNARAGRYRRCKRAHHKDIARGAEIPQAAAGDIQQILEAEHDDFDSAAIGEEMEFAGDSHYEEKSASDKVWQEEWRSF